MQWMVVYHTRLREDWRSTRRDLGSISVWLALIVAVYCTRYAVEYVWDPLPWTVVAFVMAYYVALTSPLFVSRQAFGGWRDLPRLMREAVFPSYAAAYLTSLPPTTWEVPGAAPTRTRQVEEARRTPEWALGEHLAKVAEYERLLLLLWECQGLDPRQTNARLKKIRAFENGSFGSDAIVRGILDSE